MYCTFFHVIWGLEGVDRLWNNAGLWVQRDVNVCVSILISEHSYMYQGRSLPNMLAPQPHCTKSQDCEWLFSGGKKGVGGVLRVLWCITMPLTFLVSMWVAESGRCKTETVYTVACSMQEDTQSFQWCYCTTILLVKSFQDFLPNFSQNYKTKSGMEGSRKTFVHS